jgi:UDP-N-acetylmuramate dehydrogenase
MLLFLIIGFSMETLSQMEILQDYDITNLSTLRVRAKVSYFVEPETIEELISAVSLAKEKNLKTYFLGGGSNSLLSSRNIDAFLISTLKLDFINELGDGLFEVGAGLKMPRFCGKMIHKSLTGVEFMVGIPGSIGGGIIMNAGAHGREFAQVFVSAKVLDLDTLVIKELNFQDLNFKYRSSSINPDKQCILSAVLKLEYSDKDKIRETVAHYNAARTTSQPLKAWTCGCTFKNPDKFSAGKLIQESGGKLMQIGDLRVSNVHANFFENIGAGSSIDFCNLVSQIQRLVEQEKNIKLCPEVRPIGEFTEEELKIWL